MILIIKYKNASIYTDYLDGLPLDIHFELNNRHNMETNQSF